MSALPAESLLHGPATYSDGTSVVDATTHIRYFPV